MSTDNTDRPAPQTPGTPDDVGSASASAATPVTGPVAANAPQGETSVNLTGEAPTSVKSPAGKVAQASPSVPSAPGAAATAEDPDEAAGTVGSATSA